MKFKITLNAKAFVCLIALFALVSANKNLNNLKSKTQEKATLKSQEKLDYLHYMYNKKAEAEKGKEEVADSSSDKNTFKFKSRTRSKFIYDPRKQFKYNDTIDTIQEEWFSVSSSEFYNIKRFPPIKTPDGKTQTILTNGLDFRLNSAVNCTDAARPVDERLFWFRLSNNSLYYSATKTDINILGYITVTDIYDVDHNNDISGLKEYFCFTTKDELYKEWKVCTETKETRNKWFCLIKYYLGRAEESDMCFGIPQDPNAPDVPPKVIKKPIIMVPLPSPTCNLDWDYEQHGDDWVCDCKDGVEQSPIDLPAVMGAMETQIKPVFVYYDTDAINQYSTLEGVMQANNKLQIYNTENMIHILHHNLGRITTVDGAIYQAQEITFHTPANHKIDGKEFAMEMSIIHFGITKGDIGKQVVLSFVFEAMPGVYNSFLEDLDYFNLPDPVTKKRDLARNLYLPKILYESNEDVNKIPIMRPFSFYTYSGSLPFPPCTERTINYVASKPLRTSNTIITLFKEALRMPDLKSKTGEIFPSNKLPQSNRNIQQLNGRPVYWYNHNKNCGPDPVPIPPKRSGHYEKVLNKGTQYFYVNGPEPSGLPGAFVVSEKEAKGLGAERI